MKVLPELIVCSAVKFRVYLGALNPANYKDIAVPMVRHFSPDGVDVLNLIPNEMTELEQGFLTNRGRFLNREEALEMAIKNNQIRRWSCGGKPSDILFSEDLY